MNLSPQQLLARLQDQQKEIAALKVLWTQLFPEFTDPGLRQFRVWLNLYNFEIVTHGLEKAMQCLNKRILEIEERNAGKDCPATRPMMDAGDIVKYASGCMKKRKAESEQPCVTA